MPKINIEVSARHIHLSQNDLEKLFGPGYDLKVDRRLSQSGQFAARETVAIESASGRIDRVRILGPVRLKTQVEVSLTDAFKLKIKPPIRLSGDLGGSVGIKVVGPRGTVSLKQGVIIAKRHIHAGPEDGLTDGQKVSVAVKSGERKLTFHEVTARVSEDYKLACHVDTDEGNAAGIDALTKGEVII